MSQDQGANSRFYSTLKQNPVVAIQPLPQTNSKAEGHQPVTRRWMFYAVAFILFAQIVGLIVWYGRTERVKAKANLNETVAKLKVIEKHGYDMKGFYSRMTEQDSKLRSLITLLMPFLVHGVNAEVAGVDAQISSQYSSVLEIEKQALVTQLKQLNIYLDKTKNYEYSTKRSVISYYQEVREKVSSSAITIPQIQLYTSGISQKEEEMRQSLQTVLHDSFAELESEYSVAVNYNYPSRLAIEEYIHDFGGYSEAKPPSLAETVDNLALIEQNRKTIAFEVEEQKKEVIFNTIQNTTQEVDSLLAFYGTRSGYMNEIGLLNQYKNTVSQYTKENYRNFTSAALQQQTEKDLYALVVQPRQTRIAVEEKERQELIAKQKAMEASSGIPVPPVEVPKLILVDVGKQRLYAYENGVSIFDQPVPVTTGKAGYDTVKGRFAVYLKTTHFRMRSPFPNEWYDSMVDYWMPFYQGFGFHDASWRTVYGTMDYPALGSHGCINTPYAYIQRLYNWAEIGTTVIII